MAHDRNHRYREMSELITDLDRFARGDWINPFGRVRLGAYSRLLVRRHPRKVFGIGIAIIIALVWWLVSSVLHWADSLRSSLDSELSHYSQRIEQVERRERTHVDPAFEEQVRLALEKHQDGYPEQWRKFYVLRQQAQQVRFLRADFFDPDQITQKAWLTAAVGGTDHPWHLVEEGLRLTRASKLGVGSVWPRQCLCRLMGNCW